MSAVPHRALLVCSGYANTFKAGELSDDYLFVSKKLVRAWISNFDLSVSGRSGNRISSASHWISEHCTAPVGSVIGKLHAPCRIGASGGGRIVKSGCNIHHSLVGENHLAAARVA